MTMKERVKVRLRLNIKTTRVIITGKAHDFNMDNGDISIVKGCGHLGLVIRSNGNWDHTHNLGGWG